MAETAAHLVDAVFPNVPVRQWVLWLPYRIRFLEHATLDATSAIDADGRGYSEDMGPGASPARVGGSGGAGHGGSGGGAYNDAPGGASYGSRLAPTFGSGAGSTGGWGSGGAGGGAVQKQVGGTLSLDGTIRVRGTTGTGRAGAGFGGSVRLAAGTFRGQGLINADGGDAAELPFGGGGGGGRIAVYWTASNDFRGTLRALGGQGYRAGSAGTIAVEPGLGIDWSLVRNGDFESSVLSPWTTGGGGENAGVERADVTGLGPTLAFGVAADGTPRTLAQTVVLVQGRAFLLQADLAGIHSGSLADPDAGRWEIRLAGQTIGQGELGAVLPQRARRHHVCLGFVAAKGGAQELELRLWRSGPAGPVRTYADNLRLEVAVDPAVCVREARQIGTTVPFHVLGAPSAAFVVFLSPFALGGGQDIPGFEGVLKLSPAWLMPFLTGALDTAGLWSVAFPLPGDPGLVGIPLYFQGLQVRAGPRACLGTLHSYPLIGS